MAHRNTAMMTGKLGRRRPTIASPHPPLARYRTTAATPTNFPASCDYQSFALGALQSMYANGPDPSYPAAPAGLGDCTIADTAKSVAIWTRGRVVPTVDQVVRMYSDCSGYIPGNDATDQGCDELVVLNQLKVNGLAGVTVIGSVTLNALDPAELCAAIWLFGRIRICLELPDWWTPVTGPGFTWDAPGIGQSGPDPTRGHDFGGTGYDQRGVYIDTWGLASESTPTYITFDALAKLAVPNAGGAIYASLCPEWAAQSGSGYDLEALTADASAIGVLT